MSLVVRDLSVSYGSRRVLSSVSFTAQPGELTAVLGANGAGKTTLFRCLLGLLAGEGELLLEGKPLTRRTPQELARLVAYVPQGGEPSFGYTVGDMVLMGTTAALSPFASPGKAQRAQAQQALETLGIQALAGRNFLQLSGGERQLVLLARALAQGARVLILDEPAASLDYGNALRTMNQLQSLAQSGYLILYSTHNPDQVFRYAHRVLALEGGVLIADGPPAECLTGELVSRLYGVPVTIGQLDGMHICMPRRKEV